MTTHQNPKTTPFFSILATMGRGLALPFTKSAKPAKPVVPAFSGENDISFKLVPLGGYFNKNDRDHQARHLALVAFEHSETNFNVCVFRNRGNYAAVTRTAEIIASEVWIAENPVLRPPIVTFVFTPGGARPIVGEDTYEALEPGKTIGPATDSRPVLTSFGGIPEALAKTLRDIDKHYPPTAENAVRVMTYDALDFDL